MPVIIAKNYCGKKDRHVNIMICIVLSSARAIAKL